MIVLGILAVLSLVGVIALIPLGLRAGDRSGDVLLTTVEPCLAPRGAAVTVTNPGAAPVLLGLSLRRPGPRLRLEAGSYVRVRTGDTSSALRAHRQAWIAALEAGQTETYVVPAGARVPRRAELVAVIGQGGRLRTIHRRVLLPSSGEDETGHQIREAALKPLER